MQFKQKRVYMAWGGVLVFTVGVLWIMVGGCGEVNSPPVIDTLEIPEVAIPGGRIVMRISARDPDGDPLSYVWIVYNHTLTATGAVVEWAVPPQRGITVTVEVRVSDGVNREILTRGSFRTPAPPPVLPSVDLSPPKVLKATYGGDKDVDLIKEFHIWFDEPINKSTARNSIEKAFDNKGTAREDLKWSLSFPAETEMLLSQGNGKPMELGTLYYVHGEVEDFNGNWNKFDRVFITKQVE